MRLFEVEGYSGVSRPTPRTILCAENRNGSTWYVAERGCVVNLTWEEITAGRNIEEISDADCFTWDKPINTLKQLQKAIEA